MARPKQRPRPRWHSGWGLPQPWDAFADGSTNGPNQPYTITTAIVLNGLLDALSLPDFGTRSERRETQLLMKQVILHWCRDLWEKGFGGGFFWYSPCPCDANFSVNAPAMFLGSMARFLREQGTLLEPEERQLIENRADDLAKAIVNTVKFRDGAPYWRTFQCQTVITVNHRTISCIRFTSCGALRFTANAADVCTLPWTRKQALESVDRFLHDGRVSALANDETPLRKNKSILWSTGAMLAFYARWGMSNRLPTPSMHS